MGHSTGPPEPVSAATARRFDGQTAWVTGGGSGIGAAVVRRLAAEGARVVVVDVDADAADATVASIQADRDVLAVPLDVADASAVERVLETVGAPWRSVSVLVNNAGVFDGMTPLEELTDELWERVMSINVGGAMRMTRCMLPGMLAAGTGSVVNVASTAGLASGGGGAAYTSSKFALIGLTRQVAFEVASRGVRVNAVAPGLVATNLFSNTVEVLAEIDTDTPLAKAAIDNLTNRPIGVIPQARAGMPDEIAAAVAFLASRDAAYVSGHVLTVDGGLTT